MKINEKLMNIQANLKAPKNQYNSFGKYKYRSCEDILEAVKPLLKENKMTLIISDTIEGVNNKNYVKATVILTDVENGDKIESTAFAREADNKKGMDDSQITGATSSYARKYALNGLFGIDDTKDSDGTNTHGKDKSKSPKPKSKSKDTVTTDEITVINDLIKEKGIDKDTFLKFLKDKINVSKIEDIPQVHYAKVVGILEKK